MQNCEQCGSPQVEGSRFCGNCGHALTPVETARTALSDHKIEILADASAEETLIAPRQSTQEKKEKPRVPGDVRGEMPVAYEQEKQVWQGEAGQRVIADIAFTGAEAAALGMPQASGSMPIVPGTPPFSGSMPVVPGTPPLPGSGPSAPGALQPPSSFTPAGPGMHPSLGPNIGQLPSPLTPAGPGMHPSLGPNIGQPPSPLTPAGLHVGQLPQGASLPQLPTTPPVSGMHPSLGPNVGQPPSPLAPAWPHMGQWPQGPGMSGGAWPSGPHVGQLPQGASGGSMPGVYQAPSTTGAVHPSMTQPHTAVSAAAKTAKAGKLLAKPLFHQLWFWLAVPAALVVVAAGALGTAYVFIPASLGLIGNNQTVMSGLEMQVHGSHFVPGGQITLKLDGKQTVEPTSAINVSGTGEFDAHIAGTENWSLGAHTIHASESTLSRDAVLSFKLVGNTSTVAPSVTSFDTSTGACQYAAGTGWSCSITLGIRGGQGNVHWQAASSGVNGVTFSPSSGVLTPGQSQTVAITVPDMVCPAQATFTISGWANPLNVSWSCAAPLLHITGTLCPISGGYYVCPVPISLEAGSQGMANWTITSPSPGVIIQPGSGTLSVGQTQTVNISVPQSECRTAQLVFAIVGGASRTLGLDQSRCP